MIRAGIYFLIWVSLAYFLCTWSREEDENPSPRLPARFEGLSGPGLILYGLTVTFASVDWVMSLEPHWFSTIYGMLFMVIEALTAMSFMIFFARLLAAREPALASAASPAQWNDLGNLLLAFVMLWAYLTFSQFLIIWAGNLKDEIPWYVRRISGAWGAIAVVLIIFHFMVPFLLLLSRGVKRRMEILATLAGALLLISWLDLYWLVVPAFEPGPHLHPVDLTAPLGIGGFWVATFLWQLKRRPLVPLHAVDLEEAVGHGD